MADFFTIDLVVLDSIDRSFVRKTTPRASFRSSLRVARMNKTVSLFFLRQYSLVNIRLTRNKENY